MKSMIRSLTKAKTSPQKNHSLPLISLVIPVYNSDHYLAECLDSILAQTYNNFEVILVNDGSADGSATILEKYRLLDERVVVFHQTNAGPSTARNLGIDNSRGDYIVFADSDDVMDESLLSYLYYALSYYRADIAVCGYTRFGTGQVTTYHNISQFGVTIFESVQEFALLFANAATSLSAVSVWAKMYKTSIIKTYDIRFPPSIHYEEDCCFNLEYYKHIKRAVSIKDSLYSWRQNPNSLSKAYKSENMRFLLVGYKKRVSFFEEINLSELSIKLSNIMQIVIINQLKKIASSTMSCRKKNQAILNIVDDKDVQEIFQKAVCPFRYFSKTIRKLTIRRTHTAIIILLHIWGLKFKLFNFIGIIQNQFQGGVTN